MAGKIAWTDTIIYVRPDEKFIYVKREQVSGVVCPECKSKDIKKYPIFNWMGPRIVIKCQNCFHVLEIFYPKHEDKWPPYWPVTREWPVSLAERASVELMIREEKNAR